MSIDTRAQDFATRSPNDFFEQCQACGSNRIRIVSDGDDTNFHCEGCGRCWHVDFGRVSRVDPLSCAGCADQLICAANLPEGDPFRLPLGRAALNTAPSVEGATRATITTLTTDDEIVLDAPSVTDESTTDRSVHDVLIRAPRRHPRVVQP
jgi:hypothetical protein